MANNLHHELAVQYVGICGSDLQKLRSDEPPQLTDLGHEVVASYDGEYAAINPMIECGGCPPCQQDSPMHCDDLQAVGRNLPGGLSGSITVPEQNIVAVDYDIPELGVLCDPYAVAVHGLERTEQSSEMMIVGDGVLSQLCLTYLALNRTTLERCTLVTKDASRIHAMQEAYQKTLRDYGIEFQCLDASSPQIEAERPQTVIEAVGRGQSSTLNLAIEAVQNRGTILSFGVFPIGYAAGLTIRTLLYKEVSLRGSNSYNHGDFARAASQIGQNQDLFMPMLGETYDIQDAGTAIAAASTGSNPIPKKVVVAL